MKSTIIVLAIIWSTLIPGINAQDSADEPLIAYYWEKAAAEFDVCDPASVPQLSFITQTYRHRVAPNGRIEKTDTLSIHRFYTRGELDSTIVLSGTPLDQPIILDYPDVFANSYLKNLFPNDRGGPDFSIGIVSPAADSTQPDGLVVIDRDDGHLKWLYLFYPQVEGFKRLTRSYRFIKIDNVVLPDSVWEVAISAGWMSGAHYRVETGISDITITR